MSVMMMMIMTKIWLYEIQERSHCVHSKLTLCRHIHVTPCPFMLYCFSFILVKHLCSTFPWSQWVQILYFLGINQHNHCFHCFHTGSELGFPTTRLPWNFRLLKSLSVTHRPVCSNTYISHVSPWPHTSHVAKVCISDFWSRLDNPCRTNVDSHPLFKK